MLNYASGPECRWSASGLSLGLEPRVVRRRRVPLFAAKRRCKPLLNAFPLVPVASCGFLPLLPALVSAASRAHFHRQFDCYPIVNSIANSNDDSIIKWTANPIANPLVNSIEHSLVNSIVDLIVIRLIFR